MNTEIRIIVVLTLGLALLLGLHKHQMVFSFLNFYFHTVPDMSVVSFLLSFVCLVVLFVFVSLACV